MTEVSDQLPPLAWPQVQPRFDGAADVLLKKDSADDWRACVGFNVLTVTAFTSGPDRPDPCPTVLDKLKHVVQPSDVVFVKDIDNGDTKGVTIQLNWHQIIIDWDHSNTRTLAHEFGHGVALNHPDPPEPDPQHAAHVHIMPGW